ncbi:hypothetical protein [Aequorivita marisscotiae]|uniref:Intradiol ring-cleavage dioxygenases domain-containing protein n=1 Tax=Aequorivita marisscotiae TaxID=3040348 RepID=A0ABY8KWB7_9FLAO|nr:hypothetical protein [Aequorivita sp. Ant34-E75]WGF93377.1 hypothetical protein QCQ61_04095 [Aequorivita sp. Ant34-E75]
MKKTTSRRHFMRNSAIALTGLAVLTPTVASAFTPSESPFDGYNPYSEAKKDLRTSIFNSNTVAVNGTIYKKDGVTPLSNALVEVWHLSPNSSKYRHRAKLKTDQEGRYEFVTDFPNKEKGKSSRIYFKVSNSGSSVFSELLLNANNAHITGEHWENNNQLGDKLFPKHSSSLFKTTIQFNLSI